MKAGVSWTLFRLLEAVDRPVLDEEGLEVETVTLRVDRVVMSD